MSFGIRVINWKTNNCKNITISVFKSRLFIRVKNIENVFRVDLKFFLKKFNIISCNDSCIYPCF